MSTDFSDINFTKDRAAYAAFILDRSTLAPDTFTSTQGNLSAVPFKSSTWFCSIMMAVLTEQVIRRAMAPKLFNNHRYATREAGQVAVSRMSFNSRYIGITKKPENHTYLITVTEDHVVIAVAMATWAYDGRIWEIQWIFWSEKRLGKNIPACEAYSIARDTRDPMTAEHFLDGEAIQYYQAEVQKKAQKQQYARESLDEYAKKLGYDIKSIEIKEH